MEARPAQSTSNAQQASFELIRALNAIALALQESISSEENVYRIFQEQVVALGLRGGISELDEGGNKLLFKTVAFASPLQRMLDRFERRVGRTASGYSVPIERVDVYRKVAREGRAVFVADTSTVSAQVIPAGIKRLIQPLLKFLGSPPGIFTPLIYDGKVKGMLNMVGSHLSAQDVPTMQAFANQIAVALENARLVRKLQTANEELEIAYQRTLEGWVLALELRDDETEGHTLRTVEHAARLARQLGVPEADLADLRRGALLHDIGKLAIPDSILRKPGPLTESEWAIMRQHPQTAYNWLCSIDFLKRAIDIPHYHHEQWNGRGYVDGLAGDEIPLWARIFTVVDVWDAMRSNRPYRRALSPEEAFQYIREQSGEKFDPRVVEAFFALHAREMTLANTA